MDERIKAAAIAAARQLLQRFRAAYPRWTDDTTPVDVLVEWYGLHIETFSPEDYATGTFGFLEDNEDLIWLNRSLKETLRRFTLAHELGHAVLHRPSLSAPSPHLHTTSQNMLAISRDTPCYEPDVQEELTALFEQEQLQEILGVGMSYDPRSEREQMANIFAAELLMPLERVRTLYLDQPVSAHELAHRFGVSQAAMLNRLVGLAMEPFGNETRGDDVGAQFIAPTPIPNSTTPTHATTKKQYDSYQQAAIEAPTPALIVAGPGSGKTSTLIGRVDYLIHTLDVAPAHILALTFSRKAAEEMQERLEPLFYEEGIQETQEQQRPQRPTVSTFHAFCAELLRTYGDRVGLRTNFSLVDEAEGYFLLRRLANELPLQHYRNLPSPAYYFPDILKAISRAKDELITPVRYYELAQTMLQEAQQAQDEERREEARVRAEKALEVANIYALYEAALQQRQDTDFGGLIMLAVQLLHEHPDVLHEQQQRYQHILVDEFQDINRASGVLLRHLAGADQRVWVVGDANQCQPAGTMIRLPDGSECPIEDIRPGSEIVTYDRESTMFVKKGKVTDVDSNQYDGLLYTIKAGGKQTQCTGSHKWLVRWMSNGYDAWITYLMRQGDRYRVGQTRMFLKPGVGNKNSTSDFGLASRARQEKADAAWVLKIHDTLTDALVYEQIIAAKYGLPEVVFSQSYGTKCFSQEMIDTIYNALPPLEEKARLCLEDHGRTFEYPLYLREGMNGVKNGGRQRQGRSTIFVTQACNLMSGYMAIPVAPDHIHSKRDRSMRRVVAQSWQPIEVTCVPFSGKVYSLNVETHHKYIADGLVTCNSIYGFRGASPANIANFEQDYAGAVVLPLSRNYRSRPDIVKLAESFRYKQLELGATVDTNVGAQFIAPTSAVRLTQTDTYVTLAVAPDFAGELAGLVDDIRARHAQGYAYRDIVVLCRTRTLARKITSALVDASLPVVESGGMLEQEHIKDLLSIVLLLAEPDGMGILRAARLSEHALSQNDIEAFLLAARAQEKSPAWLIYNSGEVPHTVSMEGHYALTHLSAIVHSLSIHATSAWSLLARYLFIETSIMRNVLRTVGENNENRGRMNDYLGMLQLARRYDQQQAMLREQEQNAQSIPDAEQPLLQTVADLADPVAIAEPPIPIKVKEHAKGLLDYLRVMLTLRQDGGNRQQGTESDDGIGPEVIRVMTVHASKGLEFPVVYLPNLLQQRFPLQSRSNPVPAPEGMLPPESEGSVAHESGEACLFYVGVTRARDHLILSYSERYGKRKPKLSVYLDPLIAGLSKERITHTRWQQTEMPPGDAGYAGNEDDILPLSQPSDYFIEQMQQKPIRSPAIETYQQCPRKYLYGSIYQFRGEMAAYLLFWQTTQKTMEAIQQQFAECQQKGTDVAATLPTLEQMRKVYTQKWHERDGHTLPFAPIYEQHGHEVVALLREKMLKSGNTNWELRRSFTVEVAGVPIEVLVDRVEDTPQSGSGKPAKFIRTRFGKSKEKPTVGTRELLYARAQRTQYNTQSIELHCHNLSTGETFPITLTTKKEQSLFDSLEKSVQELANHQYPAKPDAYVCPSCPFFLICPA